jgi:Family of unknown function (DUF6293)
MMRVHISAVGFEIDRIVLPAVKLKADRVWLITHSNTIDDKGFEFVKKVKDALKKEKIEVEEEKADRKDLFDTLRAFRSIVSKEQGNQIMVNVSTGSKIQSIAFMMACMMFKDVGMIKPYYAEPDEYMTISKEQETIGLRDIKLLPDYKIEIPHQNLIKCMVLINKQKDGKVTKKKLRDLTLEEKLIHVDENKENKGTAAYMALNKNIIEPLQNWNFIDIEKIGNSKIVSLSTDGRNALKFLNPNIF